MNRVEELDLYKEYKHAYDKAHELEFFDKLQEALYYYDGDAIVDVEWFKSEDERDRTYYG